MQTMKLGKKLSIPKYEKLWLSFLTMIPHLGHLRKAKPKSWVVLQTLPALSNTYLPAMLMEINSLKICFRRTWAKI